MKYTEITVSRHHQFNDPLEQFANHRICISITAQLDEDDTKGPSGAISALCMNLDEKIRWERNKLVNRRHCLRFTESIDEAIAECKRNEVHSAMANEKQRPEDAEITDWEHDMAILAVLKSETHMAYTKGEMPPEADNSKFRKVALYLPF